MPCLFDLQELPNGVSSSEAYTNASGTMIINPGDTVGASGSAMDTMIVAENSDEQSSDYLAALRAASANDYRCLQSCNFSHLPTCFEL